MTRRKAMFKTDAHSSGRQKLSVLAVCTIAALAVSCGFAQTGGDLEPGTWVISIHSAGDWAVFPCKDRVITNVCGTDKNYSDLGTLPAIISVGDSIRYRNKAGESKQFAVRHIRYFVYEKDLDFEWGGQRYTAKKGDTTCTLYDATSRSDTAERQYPSKVVIKGCRPV